MTRRNLHLVPPNGPRGPSHEKGTPMADHTMLFAPKVRFLSTNESQFDSMMTWRAEFEMAYRDGEGDTPEVVGGYAEFLTIRLGEHPIAELLDSLSQDALRFAPLFEEDDVDDSVQSQFDDAPFNRLLIITMVFVAEPLRGHNLGAWLVAEVIARMAGAIDTLVLLHPYPADMQTGDPAEPTAVKALHAFWQRTGLAPLRAHPGILGQSTAYTALPVARRTLRPVESVQIAVPTSSIHAEHPTEWNLPRDSLIHDD